MNFIIIMLLVSLLLLQCISLYLNFKWRDKKCKCDPKDFETSVIDEVNKRSDAWRDIAKNRMEEINRLKYKINNFYVEKKKGM